jgi:hypothetical protein
MFHLYLLYLMYQMFHLYLLYLKYQMFHLYLKCRLFR